MWLKCDKFRFVKLLIVFIIYLPWWMDWNILSSWFLFAFNWIQWYISVSFFHGFTQFWDLIIWWQNWINAGNYILSCAILSVGWMIVFFCHLNVGSGIINRNHNMAFWHKPHRIDDWRRCNIRSASHHHHHHHHHAEQWHENICQKYFTKKQPAVAHIYRWLE